MNISAKIKDPYADCEISDPLALSTTGWPR